MKKIVCEQVDNRNRIQMLREENLFPHILKPDVDPEFIESYYMLESSHLSEIFAADESLHAILEFKFKNMGNEDLERGSMAFFLKRMNDQIFQGDNTAF